MLLEVFFMSFKLRLRLHPKTNTYLSTTFHVRKYTYAEKHSHSHPLFLLILLLSGYEDFSAFVYLLENTSVLLDHI